MAKLDSDYFQEIESNVNQNWYNASVLFFTIPGHSCESIGTRVGIATRRLSGVGI